MNDIRLLEEKVRHLESELMKMKHHPSVYKAPVAAPPDWKADVSRLQADLSALKSTPKQTSSPKRADNAELTASVKRLMQEVESLKITKSIGIWQAYTPTWTAVTTNPAIGNGSLIGRYSVIGSTCFGTVRIATTAGTGNTTFGSGTWSIGLPLTSANKYLWYGGNWNAVDAGTASYAGVLRILPNTAAISSFYRDQGSSVLSEASPFTWANGDSLNITYRYEVA